MLSNFNPTHRLAPQRPFASALSTLHWWAAGCARALRQIRGRATVADVAASLTSYGVRTHHHDNPDRRGATGVIGITRDVQVEVEPTFMRVVLWYSDMPDYYPARPHHDIVGLAQDVFHARAEELDRAEEDKREAARPWTSTFASELVRELMQRGVPDARLVRELDSTQEGLIEAGAERKVSIWVLDGQSSYVAVESESGASLHYPVRNDAAGVAADVHSAVAFVFPPCEPA